MNTCGTCKHFGDKAELSYWDEAKENEVYIERLRECGLLKHINKSSESKRLALTAIAGVLDGSGYHAILCVSEDFGCNQWEAAGVATASADSALRDSR